VENESGAATEPEGLREGKGEGGEADAELWYVYDFILSLGVLVVFSSRYLLSHASASSRDPRGL